MQTLTLIYEDGSTAEFILIDGEVNEDLGVVDIKYEEQDEEIIH